MVYIVISATITEAVAGNEILESRGPSTVQYKKKSVRTQVIRPRNIDNGCRMQRSPHVHFRMHYLLIITYYCHFKVISHITILVFEL